LLRERVEAIAEVRCCRRRICSSSRLLLLLLLLLIGCHSLDADVINHVISTANRQSVATTKTDMRKGNLTKKHTHNITTLTITTKHKISYFIFTIIVALFVQNKAQRIN